VGPWGKGIAIKKVKRSISVFVDEKEKFVKKVEAILK